MLKHDRASSTFRQFSEQYEAASRDWKQIKQDLEAAHDLAIVMSDHSAIESIRSWYGPEFADSLNAKAVGLDAAQKKQANLMNYVALVQREQAQEAEVARLRAEQKEAQTQALIEERNNLAGEIFQKIILITMLDEKFNLTEKMGYTMEADKLRA